MGTHHNLTQDSHRLRWDSRHAALRCYHYGVSKESEGGWLLKPGAKEVIQGHGKEVYDKEVKTRRLEYKCTKIFNFYLDLGFWIGWFTFADLMTAGAQHEWRHRDVSSSEGRPILPDGKDWEIRRTIPTQDGQFPPKTDNSHPRRTIPTRKKKKKNSFKMKQLVLIVASDIKKQDARAFK